LIAPSGLATMCYTSSMCYLSSPTRVAAFVVENVSFIWLVHCIKST
jgi:hypothetical protein